MSRFPWKLVHWPNSFFLIGTLAVTLTATPVYIWKHGLSPFQIGMFLFLFAATGLSITLGYHRLFAHLSFRASWPVRLFTLVFGAAAFENSALSWAANHRLHHKFVDDEDDPYDVTKGFFHAHIGWILFRLRPEPSYDGVKDLQRDPLVVWQDRHYHLIAISAGLVLPILLGFAHSGWAGALGGLLIAGAARIVCVHHMTFFINSLCHTLGKQPYSDRCTARDSVIMAFFTFGEGYHNFHHEFQHDYRNGVKPWQFDPTKWLIWLLNKAGLATNLRRVPEEKILLAEIAQQEKNIADRIQTGKLQLSEQARNMLTSAQQRLQQASTQWEHIKTQYRHAAELKMEASRERIAELRQELSEASECLSLALQEWRKAHRLVMAEAIQPAEQAR
jgi:stearoyl-CoA desaturase (Delta-9 desaturase)